jgi:hypothetical protein
MRRKQMYATVALAFIAKGIAYMLGARWWSLLVFIIAIGVAGALVKLYDRYPRLRNWGKNGLGGPQDIIVYYFFTTLISVGVTHDAHHIRLAPGSYSNVKPIYLWIILTGLATLLVLWNEYDYHRPMQDVYNPERQIKLADIDFTDEES